MKHILLLVAVITLVISESNFPAAEQDRERELNGRELVVRIYGKRVETGETSEKKTVRIESGTFRLDPNDLEGSTGILVSFIDQKDEQVRRQIGPGDHYYYVWEGPRFHLPVGPKELEGRDVVVRAYDSWRQDPGGYHQRTISVKGGAVVFAFEEVDDSAVIAIVGADQDDELLKKVFGNRIYGWAYEKGLIFRLPRHGPPDQKDYRWAFVDALGNPLANGAVTIHLGTIRPERRVFVGTQKLDEQGRLTLGFCPGYGDTNYGREPGTFVFEVSHPEYAGVGVVQRYPKRDRQAEVRTVFVPFVPTASKASRRSIWGIVVDPDNSPVGGALIKGMDMYAPGRWLGSAGGQTYAVLTDQQGRFQMYLPTKEDDETIGTLIPPGTEYFVGIEPPRGSGVAPYTGRVPNGQQRRIQLEQGYFHTFVFESDGGPITDPRLLRGVELRIERGGKRLLFLEYHELKGGRHLPLGTYKAMCDRSSGERYEFMSLWVTAQSPQQLVLRTRPIAKVYYGQVVNGVTGGPMEGVFVGVMESSTSGRNLSQLTEEQWRALGQLPASLPATSEALRKAYELVGESYSFGGLVRTDPNGRFEMEVPGEAFVRKFVVFEQGYLSVFVEDDRFTSDAYGKFEAPLVKLFPAATVVVDPWVEGQDKRFHLTAWPHWIVARTGNPAWWEDLLAACIDDFMEGVRTDYCLHANEGPQSFYVPAGLYL